MYEILYETMTDWNKNAPWEKMPTLCVFPSYFAYYITDSFQLGRMARSKFVESFDLAQNGNSVDEHGQHLDGDGTQSPGYGITPFHSA